MSEVALDSYCSRVYLVKYKIRQAYSEGHKAFPGELHLGLGGTAL